MENFGFLFAAYTTIWLALFAYTLVLARRNRNLGKEIDELREVLRRRQGA